jgi:pyruvate kinase
MVARGDLGVELPAHEVPLVRFAKQKWQEFQLLCTQMMETMITV